MTSCLLYNSRDSGSDLPNSIITRTKTNNAEGCQKRCQNVSSCNFFLYFTADHPQWYKRRECRLLRKTGTIQPNNKGHISGPKFCHSTSTQNNDNDNLNLLQNKLKYEEFITFLFANLQQSYNGLISNLCLSNFNVSTGKF